MMAVTSEFMVTHLLPWHSPQSGWANKMMSTWEKLRDSNSRHTVPAIFIGDKPAPQHHSCRLHCWQFIYYIAALPPFLRFICSDGRSFLYAQIRMITLFSCSLYSQYLYLRFLIYFTREWPRLTFLHNRSFITLLLWSENISLYWNNYLRRWIQPTRENGKSCKRANWPLPFGTSYYEKFPFILSDVDSSF